MNGRGCGRTSAAPRWPRVVGVTVGLILAFLVSVPAAFADRHPGLGGLWLLTEGWGQVAYDSSGSGNHGMLGSTPSVDPNDPTWVARTVNGKSALHFDGDQFVTVPQSPSLESARITVGAVVRATTSPGSYRYVASKGAFMCQAASYGLYTGPGGGLIFYVSNGASYTLSPDAGIGVWDGRWHVVAGTFDGATVRLYVDGAEVGSGSPSTVVTRYGLSDDNRFYIGAYRGTCGSPLGFVGDIDAVGVLRDVVAWVPPLSRALT